MNVGVFVFSFKSLIWLVVIVKLRCEIIFFVFIVFSCRYGRLFFGNFKEKSVWLFNEWSKGVVLKNNFLIWFVVFLIELMIWEDFICML